MKKYLLTVIALLLVAVIALILLKFNNKKDDENSCIDGLDLQEIYLSISLSTNSVFDIQDESLITNYLPLDFSGLDEYLLATRQDVLDEYFIIIKDLDNEQIDFLNTVVDNQKNIYPERFEKAKINTHNNITYVIFSDEYSSVIEGIIRSYIYCEY